MKRSEKDLQGEDQFKSLILFPSVTNCPFAGSDVTSIINFTLSPLCSLDRTRPACAILIGQWISFLTFLPRIGNAIIFLILGDPIAWLWLKMRCHCERKACLMMWDEGQERY